MSAVDGFFGWVYYIIAIILSAIAFFLTGELHFRTYGKWQDSYTNKDDQMIEHHKKVDLCIYIIDALLVALATIGSVHIAYRVI